MTTLTQDFPELDQPLTLEVNTPSKDVRSQAAPALDIVFTCDEETITIDAASTNLRDATEDELALVIDFIKSNTKIKLLAGLPIDTTMHPNMVSAANLLFQILQK